jgi:hypothetical protein
LIPIFKKYQLIVIHDTGVWSAGIATGFDDGQVEYWKGGIVLRLFLEMKCSCKKYNTGLALSSCIVGKVAAIIVYSPLEKKRAGK